MLTALELRIQKVGYVHGKGTQEINAEFARKICYTTATWTLEKIVDNKETCPK